MKSNIFQRKLSNFVQSKFSNPSWAQAGAGAAASKEWATIPAYDHTPQKYTGPSYEKCMEMRQNHLSPAAFMLYKTPVMIVEGKMQYLYGHDGKRYLDLFAGVSTSGMGHCHPRITAKIKEQADKLQHTTTIYMNDEHCLYAEELAAKLPEGLDYIYFTSSGSESNALAT
jgi:alanine-glyoxylate transaminase/(R)-3-amino-2-methylpropionate-pyruvate transaminase